MRKIIHSNSGSGLIQAIVVAGVMMGSLLAVLSAFQQNQSVRKLNNAHVSATILRNNLRQLILYADSWQKTMAHPSNSSLKCLREETSCLNEEGPIAVLMDSTGAIYQNLDSKSGGLTYDLKPCNEFRESPHCAIKALIYWTPICHSPQCLNPSLKISFQFESYIPGSPAINMSPYAFELYRERI